MIKIEYHGRLGNCLIQDSAAKIFAMKGSIPISSDSNQDLLRKAGNIVNYYVGGKYGNASGVIKTINDDNFLKEISGANLDPRASYVVDGYFQNPDFVSLFKDEIKSTVRTLEGQRNKDSLLVHVRLGDCEGSSRRLPYGYYFDAIKNTNFSSGIICSDSPDHPDVKSLAREFNLSISNMSPVEILQTCNTFGKVVLSEGTFSWWIGVLSDAEEVIINRRKRNSMWHGDIFIFPEWKETLYCS